MNKIDKKQEAGQQQREKLVPKKRKLPAKPVHEDS